MTAIKTTLRINGAEHTLELDPRTTLLDLLREQLELVGTRKGCDHGQCGACTVLVNGRRINSCLALAATHHGDDVTTVEGLADGDRLSPLQAAFVHRDAFQCGFCTSGQLCSATALLAELADGEPSVVTALGAAPDRADNEELRERMSGNLCRCGAYPNIIDAIRDALDAAEPT